MFAVALCLSAVAAFYSIVGLTAIFAASVIPVVIMGTILEVAKLSITVWLHEYWQQVKWAMRAYLVPAVVVLMFITSMGIFGFLSKAHSDAGLVSGDVMAKIAVYDEKIKTERENIDAARKALTQMDAQVNERLSRSTDDRGAERAVQIRRQQQAERTRLQTDISRSQSAITKLNEERAPIAAEVRKVEAEVGPIKYIANFIYGNNPDANILEKAVTWVIIIIVVVFDPLAVILLLASQYSFQWFRTAREVEEQAAEEYVKWPGLTEEHLTNTAPEVAEIAPITETVEDRELSVFEKHPYLLAPWVSQVPEEFRVGPQVYKTEESTEEEHDDEDELAQASESEASAMTRWKADHPDSSLKLQRKLFERGVIKELPWESYLKPQPDHVDDAASEAAKWIEEQRVLADESKKKDSDLVGETRDTADQENQRNVSYVQNAEQTGSTLWQRVKAKKDEQ